MANPHPPAGPEVGLEDDLGGLGGEGMAEMAGILLNP
eukprot:CAMPEP_0184289802 /NCGR_PEP_ID=MMETSP1049-20130417/2169_1 /TAXON_ID=77928 /ORGANISM="Proteomonas sulcata, Strain CCMP704" /LENGTH=36 /DNA_ID= /DNA_START= /DNA_END= /DNA_ORIENTATION=